MSDDDKPPCVAEHECGCDAATYQTTTDVIIDAVKSVLCWGLMCVSVIIICLGLGESLPWQIR